MSETKNPPPPQKLERHATHLWGLDVDTLCGFSRRRFSDKEIRNTDKVYQAMRVAYRIRTGKLYTSFHNWNIHQSEQELAEWQYSEVTTMFSVDPGLRILTDQVLSECH